MGLPVELASLITANVMVAMRKYFLGVTMVAAQRRGGRDRGADPRRPARGHDRARHVRDRVHSTIGAFISAPSRAPPSALGHEPALIMLVIVIWQRPAPEPLPAARLRGCAPAQPARRPDRHDRCRRAVRDDRDDRRRAAALGGDACREGDHPGARRPRPAAAAPPASVPAPERAGGVGASR